ncbi:Dipeptidyl aminopeptidase/acylaminoacyl peptidase [Alteromonadaceae bacterium Bs31]|nr:Dipeptidyl aminopeptidase/acylaminoacyl peptidase [Alteromonadaceae bacterium Bs31]
MKLHFSLLCIVLFLTSISANSAPSLEAYGRLKQISKVRISPNAEYMAYRQTFSDENDNIVVRSLLENKIVATINVSRIDPGRLYFVNNDYLIMTASEHADLREYRHEFDVSTAFSYDIKNDTVEKLLELEERLTGGRKISKGQTGLGRVVGTSENGNRLFMPAFVVSSDIDRTSDYSLLRVHASGKGRPTIVSRGTGNTRDYFLDEKGNVLAREKLDNRTNIHSIERLDGKKWTKIYSYQSKIPNHNFIAQSSDFDQIIFRRSGKNAGYFQLSLSDGTVQHLDKIDKHKNTYGVVRNDRGLIVGMRYAGFSPSYRLFDDKLNKRVESIVKSFEGHSVYLTDWTKDWKHIVVYVEGSLHPGDFYLFVEGEDPKFLVSSRLDIQSKDVNLIGKAKFKARDGLIIPTLVTLPNSSLGNYKNLPTVIMPHGGPAAQDRMGFNYKAQALATRGFLVIQPQFRGSKGFGRKHYEAGWGQWGKAMQDDLTDAVNFFVKKGYTDPDRVCIVGSSYGGYAALAGAAFTPDLYQCAVAVAGVSHLPKMLKYDKSRSGKHSWVLDYWNRSILAGEYDKEALKEISPYYSAEKIKAPVLLIHGEDDTVVGYAQSKLMHKAIKKSGGKSQLIKLKNDDHYLRDGSTRTQALKAMVEFVEANIGEKS